VSSDLKLKMSTSRRFAQNFTWHEIHEVYDLAGSPRILAGQGDLEPTATVHTVVSPLAARNTLIAMRWGLIPAWWSKSLGDLPPTFNVHARRLTEPIFLSAFKRNRCIIPASGYFEWKTVPPETKEPFYISAVDGGVLSIAGVWDEWNNIDTGDIVWSCSMIITSANEFMRPVHNRMPAFLQEKDFEPWLSGAAGAEVLRPAEEDYLRMSPVSSCVNQGGRGDDPGLITAVAK
jgi:putative SOS response-associated peptidase YedK